MNELLTKGKGGIENAFTYNEREQKLNDKVVKENHLVPQVNKNKHNDFHTGKKPYVIDISTKPKANFRRAGNMFTCENCGEII